MPLYIFIKSVKIRVVLYYICKLLKLLSVILLVPLIVSISAGEFYYTLWFGIISAVSFGIGYSGKYLTEEDLTIKEALIITALSYLIFSLVGAFVFLPVTGYVNGFFESMSGFTTTGLSVLNADALPDTLLFFRSYSQWIGGAGIIVITLVVLVGPGKSASRLYTSEFSEKNLVGDVKNTGIIVIKIYLIFSGAAYILYAVSGVGFFDSFMYVFSTISTGGFSPHKESAAYYNSPLFHIFMIIFMILGATSFSTTYNVTQNGIKKFAESFELKYLLSLLFVFSILFFAAWHFKPDKILSSIFHSVTSITTTGFTLEDSGHWTPEIKLLKIFLMITGGSSESTAGGIKIIRFIMMIYLVRWMILKLLLPEEAKVPVKIGNYTFGDTEIKNAFTFFAVYIFILFLSTIIFVYFGYNVTDSVFESSSALGTVGLSTGITSAGLSTVPKFILIFEMWAGRLEIFPLFALLYPRVWVKGGDKK